MSRAASKSSRNSSRSNSPNWGQLEDTKPTTSLINFDTPLGKVVKHLVTHIAHLEKGILEKKKPEAFPDLNIAEISKLLDQHHIDLQRPKTSELADDFDREEVEFIYPEDEDSDLYANPLFAHHVSPPFKFAKYPRLTSTKRHNEIAKLYPRGSGRFSGEGKWGPGIVEYLQSLTNMQNKFPLSLQEFKEMMILSTTGVAYETMQNAVECDLSIHHIYFLMYHEFSKDATPSQAKEKLRVYKIEKDKSSMAAESAIHRLGMRASMAIAKGESRNSFKNMICTESYIQSLPDEARKFVKQRLADLSLRVGRQATFSELTSELDPHREFLDEIISKHGAQPQKPKYVKPFMFNPQQGRRKFVNQAYVQKSDGKAGNKFSQQRQGMQPQNANNAFQNANNAAQNAQPAQMQQFRPYFHKNNYQNNFRRNFAPQNAGNAGQKQRKFGNERGRQMQKRKYCSLCGENTHNAVDGCYKMVKDGKQVMVTPTLGGCTHCGLRHPEEFCFKKPEAKK